MTNILPSVLVQQKTMLLKVTGVIYFVCSSFVTMNFLHRDFPHVSVVNVPIGEHKEKISMSVKNTLVNMSLLLRN